jgi:ArsR family transcriptional regulator
MLAVWAPDHIYVKAYIMVYFAMAKKAAISATSLFRTLADPTRLRILCLIGEREVCVCYFVEALQLSQPKISRHLAYLRRSGIVHPRKDGKWVHYSIVFPSNPAAAAILREALAWTSEMPETRQDRVRFVAACCRPRRFVSLRGALPPGLASEII